MTSLTESKKCGESWVGIYILYPAPHGSPARDNVVKLRITAQGSRQSGTKGDAIDHPIRPRLERGHGAPKCDESTNELLFEGTGSLYLVFHLWDTGLHDNIYQLERSNTSIHRRFVRVCTSW